MVNTFQLTRTARLRLAHGVSQRQYQVTVKRAIYNELDFTGSRSVKNNSKNLYVWQFDTDQFEFKRLFVTRNQNVNSRVVFAPPKQDLNRLLDQRHNAAPLIFFPVAAKGPRQFYDVNFNRNGRYQLQVFVDDVDEFEIGSIQPTQAVHDGQNRESKLPIGDCDYYSFEATPCELVEVSLDSESFDSLLRLYNEHGIEIASNDDFNETTNSRISFLISKKGRYRLQVNSLGNGGGGSYNLEFNRIKFNQLELNSRASGEVERAQADFWTFEAKKGMQVYIVANSKQFQPEVWVYSPSGDIVAYGKAMNIEHSSMVAIEFQKAGKHTLRISPASGAGKYEIRIQDAVWKD